MSKTTVIAKRFVKLLSVTIITVVLLSIILSLLFLFVPKVQTIAGQKMAKYYSQKLHTRISIGHIGFTSLNTLIVTDIYIADKNRDTLLQCKEVYIKLNPLTLLNDSLEIKSIRIDTLTSKIYNSTADSTFNYQFLADYFSSSSKGQTKKSEPSRLNVLVENIVLNRINLSFADNFHKKTHTATFDNLTLKAGVFRGETSSFALKNYTTSNLTYINNTESDTIRCTIQNLSLTGSRANLKQRNITLGLIALTRLNFKQSINSPKREVAKHAKQAQPNWTITAKNLKIRNSDVYFSNNLIKKVKSGFDNNHIAINDLQFSAYNLAYSPLFWNANINQLSFREKSGLSLNQLYADINLKNNKLSINNFKFKTNHSKFNFRGTLNNFNSTTKTKSNPISLKALVDTLQIGYADLFILSPNLAKKIPRNLSNNTILVNAELSGTLNHIRIHKFIGKTGTATAVGFKGTLFGLLNLSHLRYNADELSISTSRMDIVTFGTKYIDTSRFNIPDYLHLMANGKGSSKHITGKVELSTSEGNLLIAPSFNGINKPKSAAYTIAFETEDLNIGRFLKKESLLGRISLNGSVNGAGLTLSNAATKLNLNIPYFEFQKYRYRNISILGDINTQNASYCVSILDSNINATITGDSYINGKNSTLRSNVLINKFNLQELGFTSSPVSLASAINLRFDNFDLDSLNAKIYTDSLKINNNERSIKIDTLQIVAGTELENRSISVKSDYVDALISGSFRISKVGQAARFILSGYLPGMVLPIKDSLVHQHIVCQVATKNLSKLKTLLPDLNEIEPISISADINTSNEQVKMEGDIPRISYGQIDLSHGKITSNLIKGEGDIKIEAEKFKSGAISIFSPLIDLSKKGEQLNINLTTNDSLNIGTLYQLGANVDLNLDKIRASLLPDIILNGDSWNMDRNNIAEYDSKGLLIGNFNLSRGSQILKVTSIDQKPNDPVRLNFENFRIKTLTSFAGLDTSYFRGILDGNITIFKLSPSPVIASNLTVFNTVFRKNLLGDLTIKIQSLNADRIGTNISLSGNGNDIQLHGSYHTLSPNAIDGTLNINSLNISLLEPLTNRMLTKPSGKLSGSARISGTLQNPKVLGEVNFENTAIMVAPINTFIKFKNEKILLSEKGFEFDKFTLLDSAGNKFSINGLIGTHNYIDYKFDLSLTSKGFEIVRKKENDNSIVYGPVWIDADARISGNTNLPKITATTSILPKSKLTIILPETEGGVSSREGVVMFMDSLAINKSVVLNFEDTGSVKVSKFKGIDLNANIAIDREAELLLNLSPNSGDVLDVQGDAKLNATIDPSGKFSLSGKYQITKGSYDLNFNGLMQRKFEIGEGSSITWRGAPTDADVNLTAYYKVKASPIDLISDKASDMDPTKLSSYRQKQDFLVYLIVKGDLLKPDISFKIEMPEESQGILDGNVYSLIKELNQTETEQKKQVAALLLLGRFVANNPFVSLSGSSTGSTIRQSASRILTDQLNSIADELISGVDLDFNLESKEDFSTGESKNQTNLNVGISKNLGDRVSVYVGSNFELERATPNAPKTNIAGDVAVEYKLSKDGRYRIKVFRKNEYEAVIAGEVVETGVTFNLTMDYNKFKELFMRAKARNQKR